MTDIPIDVAIPTYGGANVIKTTLDKLADSAAQSEFTINRVLVDYKRNSDHTDDILWSWGEKHNVDVEVHVTNHNLPEAREFLINEIETEWFLFLDDDVRLRENTLRWLHAAVSPLVGGVQVKKAKQTDDNAKWSKWRPVRATTFATLLRTDAVKDVEIPSEMTVLEDEYIRQHIENESECLWINNHQAVVDHDNQGRHGIDSTEGYLAGKYKLLPYDYVLMNVPYNFITLNHPIRHTARALGYCYGVLKR